MSVPHACRYRRSARIGASSRHVPVGHAPEWRDRLSRCQFEALQRALDNMTRGRKQ